MYPIYLNFVKAILFVLVLVLEFAPLDANITCLEKERQALLQLKQGFVDPYGRLSSWGNKDGGIDCCKWKGIQCNNNTRHVQKLDLHADDDEHPLRGEISASLMELQHLDYLDLSWNDFHGKKIPEFIGSLTSLRYLCLSHASFSGKIPAQLGNLSNLQVLDLHKNHLVGEIPYQLGNLSSLQQLILNNNNLGGTVPRQLGNLSRLERLYLGLNDYLQFDIQNSVNVEWISHLSSLAYLSLDNFQNLKNSKNWMQMIGQLSKLKSLSLANCSLSDTDLLSVPPSLLNFSNSVTQLSLSNNNFTSSIFSWLFHLNSSLTILELDGNLLQGPIPNDLGSINSLQILYLDDNLFNGTLPKTIAFLSELHSFTAHGNLLEGVITDFVPFANLTKLTLLDLSHNPLTFKFSNNWVPQFQLESLSVQSCKLGPAFPNWLQTQKNLNTLDVSNAGISGTASLVSFLCNTTESLSWLNMSNNHLTGQLPDCWNRLRWLSILDISDNEFSGNIPSLMSSLLVVRHLILRNNHFSGQLPSMKNCTNLVMLDVAQNELVGPIPLWIDSNLHQLQVLSLRKNHFHGSLPLYLCHLTSIHVLDLSHNNLSGQIPHCLKNFSEMAQEPGFTEFEDQIYIFKNGSPSFYLPYDFYPLVRWKGKELPFKDNKRLLKMIDLSGNQLSGRIPAELGDLLKLVSLDLSSNNLSGQIPSELGNLRSLDFLDLSRNRLSGTIPSSLSQIDRLGVLNLSYNNLSGKIPLGTQLQSFDASVYDGNAYLCGSPLKRLCPNEKKSKDPLVSEKHEDDHDDGSFTQGFYLSMGLGFFTGFWAIFGSLLIFRSWRHAYFNFQSNMSERIGQGAIINVARYCKFLNR